MGKWDKYIVKAEEQPANAGKWDKYKVDAPTAVEVPQYDPANPPAVAKTENPLMKSVKDIASEGFVKPAKTFYSGTLKSSARQAEEIGWIARKASKVLGMPDSEEGITKYLSESWNQYADKLEKEGLSDGLIKEMYMGAGSALADVAGLTATKGLGVANLPVRGAISGYKEGGVEGAVVGATGGAVAHGVLGATGQTPSLLKLPSNFLYGFLTADGDMEKRMASGFTMVGLGGLQGKGTMAEYKAGAGKYTPVVGSEAKKARAENRVNKAMESAKKEISAYIKPTKGKIQKLEKYGNKKMDRYYELAVESQLPLEEGQGTPAGKRTISTTKAQAKIREIQAKVSEQLDLHLGAKTDKVFNLEKIRKTAENALRKNVKFQTEYEFNLAKEKMGKYIEAEINKHGVNVDGITLNKIKQGLWGVSYNNGEPNAQTVARTLGWSAKNAIESTYNSKVVKGLNDLSGDYATLGGMLEKAHESVQPKNLAGRRKYQIAGAGAGALLGVTPLPMITGVAGGYYGSKIGGKLHDARTSPEKSSSRINKLVGKAGREGASLNKVMIDPVAPTPTTLENVQGGRVVRRPALIGQDNRLALPEPSTKGLPEPKYKKYGEGFSMSNDPKDWAFKKKPIPEGKVARKKNYVADEFLKSRWKEKAGKERQVPKGAEFRMGGTTILPKVQEYITKSGLKTLERYPNKFRIGEDVSVLDKITNKEVKLNGGHAQEVVRLSGDKYLLKDGKQVIVDGKTVRNLHSTSYRKGEGGMQWSKYEKEMKNYKNPTVEAIKNLGNDKSFQETKQAEADIRSGKLTGKMIGEKLGLREPANAEKFARKFVEQGIINDPARGIESNKKRQQTRAFNNVVKEFNGDVKKASQFINKIQDKVNLERETAVRSEMGLSKPATDVTADVKKISKTIPQSQGAGLIPKETSAPAKQTADAVKGIESKIKAYQGKYPSVSGGGLVNNAEYGVTFTPCPSCRKGEVMTKKMITLRESLDKSFSHLPKDQRNAIKTASARKLFEAGIKQKLETPCPTCYTTEKQVIGYQAKPISKGRGRYEQGMLQKKAGAVEQLKRDGIIRGYGTGDFTADDIPSVYNLGRDLAKMNSTAGFYTKNLNQIEVFGDTGLKYNISTANDVRFGVPKEIAHEYAKRYKNVGLEETTFTDKATREALADSRVHSVIPAHLGGGTPAQWVADATGTQIQDFKKFQTEKVYVDGKRGVKLTAEPKKNTTTKKMEDNALVKRFGKEKIETAIKEIKKATDKKDAVAYLKAVDRASKSLGVKIDPKFPQYVGEKGYYKLIGTGLAEYGKDASKPTVNMDKMNAVKAQEYFNRPDMDMTPTAQKYSRISEKIFKTAKKGGAEAVNKLDAKKLIALMGVGVASALVQDDDKNRRK